MMLRLLRRLLTAEALGWFLVLLALQVFTYGISSSLRGTDTTFLFWVCLLAAGIGYILNKRQFNGIPASFVAAALGIIGVWIAAARLAVPILELVETGLALIPQILPAIRDQLPIDTAPVREAWIVIGQISSMLAARWQTWLAGVSQNIDVNDPLIRSMIWTLLMWCLAAWTGWFTARRSAVLALLPNIALLAAVLSYSEYRIEALWMMVFLMLLLMGVWNYRNHTTQWQRRRVDYSDSIMYDSTQAVVFLAIAIGVVAFMVPSISWRDLQNFFRERNTNEAAEVLGIREQPVIVQNIPAQKPSLPREHLLTGGFAQSEELVMTIRTGELPPIMIPAVSETAPRYYWRSTVYNEYMGAGWLTSASSPQNYRANTPLVPGLLDGYRMLRMEVNLRQPEGKLYWSGVLYSADIPFRANWRVRPQTSLFADQTALLQADIFAAATEATSYTAQAYIPLATVEELRLASTEYPEEVRARYLKLPPDLPGRVHDLAQEITAGIDNPYDKAKAIERYLRTEYPYDLEVSAPPEDQDVADYFLFDLKRGYCDYYATAMVVLARSSGLPARFVSGYAPGLYDAPNAQYVVLELHAHSWPEIYFPEIGWIEFEPTAAQPEIERIETVAQVPASGTDNTLAEKFLAQLTRTRLLYWLSPLLIALGLVSFYFAVLERVWILRLAPSHAIASLYRRFYRLGRPLAGPRTRAETATEFTYKLTHNMEEVLPPARRSKTTGQFTAEAQQLTNLYLLSLFSNHSLGKLDVTRAFDLWKQLRRQLLVARLNDIFARGIKRFPRSRKQLAGS